METSRQTAPGTRVVDWLYESNPASELAELEKEDLVEMIMNQTDLIPTQGLQPGCAIAIPKSDFWRTMVYSKHHLPHEVEETGDILLLVKIILLLIGDNQVRIRCTDRSGKNVSDLTIEKAKCKPATKDQITSIANGCFSLKWSM